MLVYRATGIPVGDDQRQHIELARDAAKALNRACGKPSKRALPRAQQQSTSSSSSSSDRRPRQVVPSPVTLSAAAPWSRIMSLRDGRRKMSKSDPSVQSRLELLDTSDEIVKKIRRAKTDSGHGFAVDAVNRPERTNLL